MESPKSLLFEEALDCMYEEGYNINGFGPYFGDYVDKGEQMESYREEAVPEAAPGEIASSNAMNKNMIVSTAAVDAPKFVSLINDNIKSMIVDRLKRSQKYVVCHLM